MKKGWTKIKDFPGFIIAIPICLFSPWVSMQNTCFLQGVKACDLMFILGIYLIVTYIQKLRRDKIYYLRLSRLDLIVLFYSSYLALSAILSWNRLDKEVLLGYMVCGLLYITARNMSERQIRQILAVLPLLLVWQLWYGIAQQTDYFYPGKGIELVCGSFLNTGIWSCFVACVAITMCGQLFRNIPWWIKGMYSLGILLSVYLLFIGHSRAAWLGFIAGIGYLLYKNIKKIHRVPRWLLILLLMGLLTGAGLTTWHKSNSALGRMLIWKISGQMCLEQPLGRGVDGFRRDYMGYQQQYFEQGGSPTEKMLADENLFAFNDFLRILVEQGIIGMMLSLILVYFIFKEKPVQESDSSLLRILKGVILVWLIFSLFSYPSSHLQTKSIFVMFVAMLSSRNARIRSFNGKWVTAFGLSTVILLCVLEVYPFRKAIKVWNTCSKNWEVPPEYTHSILSPLMNTPGVLPNCALFLNKKGETETAALIAERGIRLYHSYGCYIELGIAREQQGKPELAAEAWQKAENLIPNRFKPLYLQMEMWKKAGKWKKAMELADKLLSKKIKVLSPELYSYLGSAKNIKSTFKTKCL